MAKKKVNVRKDYSYEAKKRLPAYKPAKIQRKIIFLILRGPGLNHEATVEENEDLKKCALLKHKKLKFVQVKSIEDAVDAIKDSNTWAGGVVFNAGNLVDEAGAITKAIKSILIKTREVKGHGACVKALEKLIETQA